MSENTQEVLSQMSEASYEFHKGMAMLARGADNKPRQEILDGLAEAEMALEEQRKTVEALKARLVGGDVIELTPVAANSDQAGEALMARDLTAQESNLRDMLKLKVDQLFGPEPFGRELYVALSEVPTPYGPFMFAIVTVRVYPSPGTESRHRLHWRLVQHLNALPTIHNHSVVVL